jgi:hypothetical protein
MLKLTRFAPLFFGLTLLVCLWLFLPHPAESNDYTVCPTGCDYTNIQSAATNVPEGSTILVAADVYQGNIIITKSLSLHGVGPFSTTLSGRDWGTVLTIGSSAAVSVSNLDIHSGAGILTNTVRYAGGIYNQGFLTLTNVIVHDNKMWGDGVKGSGIYNESEAKLTLIETVVADNGAFTTSVVNHGYGAGVYNLGFLTILSSTLQDNLIDNVNDGLANAYGGAIYNGCSATNCGTTTISNSLLANNTAFGAKGSYGPGALPGGDAFGGAIYNDCNETNCGLVTIHNSTMTGNQAIGGQAGAWPGTPDYPPVYYDAGSGYGGGIFSEGGIIHIHYSTLSNNQAMGGYAGAYSQPGIGSGGGIAAGNITLKGTILAGNESSDLGTDCYGWLSSQGYNLIQKTADCFISGDETGNIIGQYPNLLPLANFGGPTLTHALAFHSPAVDAADPLDCPPTDHRGVPRPIDGNQDGDPRCDIGAYERLPPTDHLYLPLLPRP